MTGRFCICLYVYEPTETKQEERKNLEAFFLSVTAFMMLETIRIMGVALLIGNTWHVTGYVIFSILAMAYIGNYLVLRNFIKPNLLIEACGLIGSLILCW